MKLIKLIPFLAIIITSKNAHAQKDTANEIKVFDSGTGNVFTLPATTLIWHPSLMTVVQHQD